MVQGISVSYNYIIIYCNNCHIIPIRQEKGTAGFCGIMPVFMCAGGLDKDGEGSQYEPTSLRADIMRLAGIETE